ncbi:putative amidotransferase subunit A [Triangularia setosa]|uniref:Amidotransferase subunit A n=1 Tax=Triangularia setosa TaxID=2587417 RepID=A0AAN6WCW4_9PEZI|nr:putative amidotransferase subunit A [Podospora setosa]
MSVKWPCTVLYVNKIIPTTSGFQDTLDRFLLDDDVWSKDFAHSFVIQTNLSGHDNVAVRVLSTSLSRVLPEGPYFLTNGKIHQAFRLYPDTSGAFVVSTVPGKNSDAFRFLDASAYGEKYPSALTVAVPSRLYFQATPERPYARLRLAIKDTINLKGLKMGALSLAYTSLHPPRESNAEVVKELLDLGFVVTTQFADSEWPICDWIDYHAPFNPRGDGHLTTSGSSANSAAAVASYPWLDFALGTDTLGTIRAPAAAQGIFEMRLSLGAASFKGIVPYSPKFDTVGRFSRTAKEFKVLAEALYDSRTGPGSVRTKPIKILYPTDYWPLNDQPMQEVLNNAISKLEDFLGNPSEYFEPVFEWGSNPDQWTGFFKDFLPQYEARFGKPPALNPQLRSKTDEDDYSSTLMVLPWTDGQPDYRDRYHDGPQLFTGIGFFFYHIEPEKLPAALGILGPKGSDASLARLVSDVFGESDEVKDYSPGSQKLITIDL